MNIILVHIVKNKGVRRFTIAILATIFILAYMQVNVIVNSLYYSQHTPKSENENVFGIIWSRHYKKVKLKRMRYRNIIYDDYGTVVVNFGKYVHNEYPYIEYEESGKMNLHILVQRSVKSYEINRHLEVIKKTYDGDSYNESEESTDITKEDIEEIKRNIDLLMTPILKEIKEPVINLQWLFNWEYENNII